MVDEIMKFSIENNSTIKKLDQLVITVTEKVSVMQPIFKLIDSNNDEFTPIVYSEYYETNDTTCIFFMPTKLPDGLYKVTYVYGGVLKNSSGEILIPEFQFNLKNKKRKQQETNISESVEVSISTLQLANDVEQLNVVSEPEQEQDVENISTEIDELFIDTEVVSTTTLEDIKEELNNLALTIDDSETDIDVSESNVLTMDRLTISQNNKIYLTFATELISVNPDKVLVTGRNGIISTDIYSVYIDTTDKYTLILEFNSDIKDLLLQVFLSRGCIGNDDKLLGYILLNARNDYINSYELTIKTLYSDATDTTIIDASGYILNKINNIRQLNELTVDQISRIFECVIQADNSPYSSNDDFSSTTTPSELYLSSATLGDLSASWSMSDSSTTSSTSDSTENRDFSVLDYRMCFVFADGLGDLGNVEYSSINDIFGRDY